MDRDRIELNRAVVARFLAGTHGGDLSVIDETVTEDIVTHGFPGGRNPASRQEYRRFFEDFGRAFSGMAFEATSVVADPEQVAVRFVVAVDHTGEFAGQAPTGRRVVFPGMALYRLREGRIAETWLHLDELALLAQTGALAAT